MGDVATESPEDADTDSPADDVPRPVYLRRRVRHGLKWCVVSLGLLLWVWWVIADWGVSVYILAYAAFGVFAFLVFLLQAIRPALELRRMDERIF